MYYKPFAKINSLRTDVDKSILLGDDVTHVVTTTGSTPQIIKTIMAGDKLCRVYTKDSAQYFLGGSVTDICKKLWSFVRSNVHYVEDRVGIQDIKSPGKVWRDKIADCKSMALFCASVLQNLGIPYNYRFVSKYMSEPLHHVYLIVDPNGAKIPLDCVWDRFGEEPAGIKKKQDRSGQYFGVSPQMSGMGSVTSFFKQPIVIAAVILIAAAKIFQ